MKARRRLSLLLTLLLVLSPLLPARADGEPERSGVCGDGLTWTLDEDGTLWIEGAGEMDDWEYYGDKAPWQPLAPEILAVRVGEGVTSVGSYAFSNCGKLREVALSGTVTGLRRYAFHRCSALEELSIPDGVTGMAEAVSQCYLLKTLRLGAGVEPALLYNSCSALERIEVSPDNPYLCDVDGVLYAKDGSVLYNYPPHHGDEVYAVPAGVEVIWRRAFCIVNGLRELTLPDGLRRIDRDGIYYCADLHALDLPASLRELGDFAVRVGYGGQPMQLRFAGPEALLAGIRVGSLEEAELIEFSVAGEAVTTRRITLRMSGEWISLLAVQGWPFPALPDAPDDGDRHFRRWTMTDGAETVPVTSELTYTWDTYLTLRAEYWNAVRMKLMACGGTLNGPDSVALHEDEGWVLSELPPEPGRAGWRFLGWYTARDGGERVEAGDALGELGALYAHWELLAERGMRDGDAWMLGSQSLARPAGTASSLGYYSTARWAHPLKQVLAAEADGSLSCVCYADGKLLVSRYDSDGTLLDERTVPLELPLYGGFFAGETYYFVASGQENRMLDDTLEVIRVTRYDRDWNRIDAVSVRACYTVEPFHSGSLRMAENGTTLLVHTARLRYDGHQSQLTLWIDTETMTVRNGLGDFQANHVSHSFDQFALPEGDGFALLDHGDAYPRSVVLTWVPEARSQTYPRFTRVNLFSIPGSTGANCTGVSVGGFVRTDAGYLAAINSIDHSLATGYTSYVIQGIEREFRDVLLLGLAAGSAEEGEVAAIRLTDYTTEDKSAGVPRLACLGPDLCCVLWEEYLVENRYSAAYQCLCYTFVDGSGTPLSDVFRLVGPRLSADCEPIVWQDRVVWFADDGAGGRTLYGLRCPDVDTHGAAAAVTETETEDGALRLTAFCHAEGAKLLCAWYRADGRLLEVRGRELVYGINYLEFENAPENAAELRVFFTDGRDRPLAPAQALG